MSSDFAVVDPRGWEYDLHSVYSAYIGYFQLHNIQWYERSWGPLFSSFEEFVTFSWPVITVTDTWTGKPHIVTRLTSIGAFLKMIKTRYGETLPQAPNILQVTPMETSSRHLRTVSDYSTYKKLYATLPAVYLSALKVRVRAGEPKAIRDLWAARQHTFLAVDFEWSERNEKSCLEWGYAAIRCAHLDAAGVWPPVPDSNYRKGHYVVNEYVDVHNKHCPTHPWEYSFGESQVCPKTKLPGIIQAMISSLASPDSETTANTLVLVAHGVSGDLSRMEEMKIKLPHNLLIIDTAAFERALYSAGHRNSMIDPHTSKPRAPGSTLSLENLLRSLPAPPPAEGQPLNPAASLPQLPPAPGIYPQLGAMIPGVVAHCSGNDAFMCLYALQLLLEPEGTQAPVPKKLARPAPWSAPAFMGQMPMMTGNGMAIGGMGALTADFSGLAMHSRQRSRSPGPTLAVPGSSPGNIGRNSKRLSVAPVGDGWSTVRRG